MLGFQQVLLFAQFPNLFFVPLFNPCGGFFLLLIQTGQFQGIVFAELLFVLCATMFADPGAQNAQLNSTYLSGAELASVRLPQSAVPETAVMSLIWWTQQSSE